MSSPLFDINPADPTPIYAQLERAIKAAIVTGALQTGEQLPTVRQLAVDLRVNANTVAKVYAELERLGVVGTRRGVGTFVIGHQVETSTRRQRERDLRVLGDRLLAEAAALGFTIDDIIAHLQVRRAPER